MAAEKEFRAAKSDPERLQALQEMLRAIPKHKGTDKMCADIKRRISQLKKSMAQTAAGKKGFSHHVPREGAGQIALVGGPNVGKSQLLRSLTNAEPDVADYPYTTTHPMPGMMEFRDIKIQLVDLPPFSPEHTEPWLPELVRAADAALLVVDLAGFPLKDIDVIDQRLERVKVRLVREPDPAVPENIAQIRTLLVCNKIDRPGARESFAILREFFAGRFPLLALSAIDHTNLDALRQAAFGLVHRIRIYAKEPGHEPDLTQPFTVSEGSTLLEFAQHVHKDFVHLKFARLWGPSAKFDGQAIQKDHVLQDGDIVELHL
jgi:ribosome-interacting GTPase 1